MIDDQIELVCNRMARSPLHKCTPTTADAMAATPTFDPSTLDPSSFYTSCETRPVGWFRSTESSPRLFVARDEQSTSTTATIGTATIGPESRLAPFACDSRC